MPIATMQSWCRGIMTPSTPGGQDIAGGVASENGHVPVFEPAGTGTHGAPQRNRSTAPGGAACPTSRADQHHVTGDTLIPVDFSQASKSAGRTAVPGSRNSTPSAAEGPPAPPASGFRPLGSEFPDGARHPRDLRLRIKPLYIRPSLEHVAQRVEVRMGHAVIRNAETCRQRVAGIVGPRAIHKVLKGDPLSSAFTFSRAPGTRYAIAYEGEGRQSLRGVTRFSAPSSSRDPSVPQLDNSTIQRPEVVAIE